MKRTSRAVTAALLVPAAVGLSMLAIGGGGTAHAQTGGTAIVSAFNCIVGAGGHVTRPAGSEIIIRQGYATTASGGIGAFMRSETTIVSVNDAPMVDVSSAWEIQETAVGGLTRLDHPTGVTIGAGESMRFTFALVFNHPLTDPSDYDGDGTIDPNRGAAGLAFGGTCTVTGA